MMDLMDQEPFNIMMDLMDQEPFSTMMDQEPLSTYPLYSCIECNTLYRTFEEVEEHVLHDPIHGWDNYKLNEMRGTTSYMPMILARIQIFVEEEEPSTQQNSNEQPSDDGTVSELAADRDTVSELASDRDTVPELAANTVSELAADTGSSYSPSPSPSSSS